MSHRLVVFLSCALLGCSTGADRYGRSHISPGIEKRTGQGLGPGSEPGETAIPKTVVLEDGLSEDEAVAIALWNNAAFQEALAELGIKRAELIQAGLLSNPVFSVFFPLGSKQLEFTANLPVEALLLRPHRMDAAKLECERVSALLVQGGLDLVRDVRMAYTDLVLARQRARIAGESAALHRKIAEFFEARLRAGAVSELEASTARIEALQAQRESVRLSRQIQLVEQELRALLGFGIPGRALEFREEALNIPGQLETEEELLEDAFLNRPDLRAAELAVDAAAERAGLADWEFIVASALVDANEEGKDGFEIGPGLQVEVPLFNWNQGGRARARAELERAARRFVTLRHRITREVGEGRSRFLQASEEWNCWRLEILPSLESTRRRAEKAHEKGETSILPVLQVSKKFLEGRLREAEAAADLRRARAQLERSLGFRLEHERKE